MMNQNISPLFAKVKQYAFLTEQDPAYKFADMKFGERIRLARKHRGLTQEQLSEASAVSQSLISQLERSPTATGSEYVVRLAKALRVSVEWLSDEIGEMELPSSAGLQQLITLYTQADERGRDSILRVAEAEAHYANNPGYIEPIPGEFAVGAKSNRHKTNG